MERIDYDLKSATRTPRTKQRDDISKIDMLSLPGAALISFNASRGRLRPLVAYAPHCESSAVNALEWLVCWAMGRA
ncbi:MAG: hypothetical protein M3480_05945 [Verrucomicrobiota bacterium]|nr:hypothetical protein [Verrucomicrobiota bacterium]